MLQSSPKYEDFRILDRWAYTSSSMSVHIAIPEPTSSDSAYNQRSLPPYLAALHSAGVTLCSCRSMNGRIELHACSWSSGILLPGSGYDVDPQRYGRADSGVREADPGARLWTSCCCRRIQPA